MLFKNLALITVAAVAVNAQLPSISPCILACIEPAATQNNCTFTDPACVCASAQFQADATKCLTDNCTPDDVQGALALQTAQCGAIGVSPSGSATPNPVSFTNSASASGSSTPASTATSSNASSPAASQTSPAATPDQSKGAATALVANGGAIFGALLAGVLAL